MLAKIDPQQVEGEILQAQATLAQDQHSLAQAKIVQGATATGIYSTIRQDQAAVASAEADYNEASATYDATVGAAHEATVEAQSKVRSAESQVQTTQANVELAEANLRDASAKFKREYTLYSQGLVAPQDADDAKAAMQVDQETLISQQKTLQATRGQLVSAQAEERAAENQETITRKKGLSNIQDAKSALTQAKNTLQTAAANRAQIPAYTENLDALYSTVLAAKAALNQAIAKRAYLIVRSSVDGTVTQRLADPGTEASPGTTILTIQYLKWLFLTAYLPVDVADTVKPGAQATITLDSFPGKTFHGVITDINKAALAASRQFMVRLKMPNPDQSLRPGMFARISLVGSVIASKTAVPRSAVTFAVNGTATVTTVDDKDIAHVVSVTYGVADSKHVDILTGLKAGDKVVTDSESPVYDGSPVKVGKVLKKAKKNGGAQTAQGQSTGGGTGEPASPTSAPGTSGGGPAQGGISTGYAGASSGGASAPSASAAPGNGTPGTGGGVSGGAPGGAAAGAAGGGR